jgi:hypothetical protein
MEHVASMRCGDYNILRLDCIDIVLGDMHGETSNTQVKTTNESRPQLSDSSRPRNVVVPW